LNIGQSAAFCGSAARHKMADSIKLAKVIHAERKDQFSYILII
jgi:hypothetical protein